MLIKQLAASALLIALNWPVIPASAQAREYDELYPYGVGHTLEQESEIIAPPDVPGRHLYLRGKVSHKRYVRSNDTVYGKTLELDLGMGGAHLR